jgi:hypothetical protein
MHARTAASVAVALLVGVLVSAPVSAARAPLDPSPGAVRFGSVRVGQGTERRVALVNTTETEIIVYALSVGAGFGIGPQDCFGQPLAANERCSVRVAFAPVVPGDAWSALRVQYCFPTDPSCPGAVFGQERVLDVALSGRGRA